MIGLESTIEGIQRSFSKNENKENVLESDSNVLAEKELRVEFFAWLDKLERRSIELTKELEITHSMEDIK